MAPNHIIFGHDPYPWFEIEEQCYFTLESASYLRCIVPSLWREIYMCIVLQFRIRAKLKITYRDDVKSPGFREGKNYHTSVEKWQWINIWSAHSVVRFTLLVRTTTICFIFWSSTSFLLCIIVCWAIFRLENLLKHYGTDSFRK